MISRKERLIRALNLSPHPEGGYFRETYRSPMNLPVHQQTEAFDGPRAACTGIYYLLGAGDFSAFHRIKSDEMWHHYEGEALTIHQIFSDGLYQAVTLGRDIGAGGRPQYVIPAGTWFAVTVDADPEANPDAYTLAGCTVSPGFDFKDFEMAKGYMLKNAFPEHADLISELVRD